MSPALAAVLWCHGTAFQARHVSAVSRSVCLTLKRPKTTLRAWDVRVTRTAEGCGGDMCISAQLRTSFVPISFFTDTEVTNETAVQRRHRGGARRAGTGVSYPTLRVGTSTFYFVCTCPCCNRSYTEPGNSGQLRGYMYIVHPYQLMSLRVAHGCAAR